MAGKPKITALVYAKDEEGQIGDLIDDIRDWVDEILVLDGGSTDRTENIVRSKGVCFMRRHPEDLRLKRGDSINRYMPLARNDWILAIDCDERLEEELKRALPHLISDSRYSAYRFPRRNYVRPGVWWKYGTYYPNYQLRLFDRRRVRFLPQAHVEPEVDGEVKNTNFHIIHLKYLRTEERIQTQHNEYSEGEPEEIKNPILFFLLYIPVLFYFFILQRGILEPDCWGDLAFKRAVYYTRYPHHIRMKVGSILGKIMGNRKKPKPNGSKTG